MSCGKPSSATLSYRLKVAGNIHIPGGHQLYFPLNAVTYRQTDDNRASGLLSSPWFRSSTTYRQPAARQALSPARKKSSSAPVSGPVQYICSPLAPAPAPDSSARIIKCLFPSLPMPPQEPPKQPPPENEPPEIPPKPPPPDVAAWMTEPISEKPAFSRAPKSPKFALNDAGSKPPPTPPAPAPAVGPPI